MLCLNCCGWLSGAEDSPHKKWPHRSRRYSLVTVVSPDWRHYVASSKDYASLKMPVVIIAGEQDRLVDINKQSARIHRDVTESTLHRLPGVGHMVHQSATDAVMASINEAAGSRREQPVSV